MEKEVQELTKYKNLSSFQFIDTINSLLGAQFRANCEKFSLKDKAHIRNMLKEIDGHYARQMAKIKEEAKESKLLSKEYNQIVKKLQEIDNNQLEMQQVSSIEEELQKQFDEQQKVKQSLMEKFKHLKEQHKKLVEEKNQRESIITGKYNEAWELMNATKKTLLQEIDSLNAQKSTNTFGRKIGHLADEQELKLKIKQAEKENQDLDIKIEKIKQKSHKDLAAMMKRYQEVQLEYQNKLAQKNKLQNKYQEISQIGEGLKEDIKEIQEEIDSQNHKLQISNFEYRKAERRLKHDNDFCQYHEVKAVEEIDNNEVIYIFFVKIEFFFNFPGG